MDFTSRQLRAFCLVAERRSFSRAAESLFVTPSAVSLLIRELELQTRSRLLERTTRQVSLTAAGRSLLPVAQRLLDEFERATMSAAEHAHTDAARVSVGAAPLIASNLLPSAIKEFRVRRPAVRISVFDADLATVIQRIQAGSIDLAVGVFNRASGVHRQRLFSFSFILIRPDDGARAKTSTAWSAIGTETLIALPSTSPIQHAINRQLARAAVRRAAVVAVNALDTQIAMVEAGEGAAIIPSFGIPVCRSRNVVMSRLVNPVVTLDFHEIRSVSRKLSPAGDEFSAFLAGYLSRWAGHAGLL